jgi:competence protein ComEC
MQKTLNLILGLVCAVILLTVSDVFPSKVVKVWVFDVGQGDAIFIDAPHKQILIDGGGDKRVLERLAAVMPWWDRSIDIVVNTHPHADHLAGLVPVLERYKVAQVLDADEGYTTPEFAELLSLAGGRRTVISSGDVIDFGGGATLTVLWPPEPYGGALLDDPNDGSIVALFEYGDTTMLLTGDAGIAEESAMLESAYCCRNTAQPCSEHCLSDIDILKVGHHGSDTSSSQAFIDRIKPEIAIISVGVDNDYGHPSTFVIDRLTRAGAQVFRTDLDGTIRLKSRGDEPLVKNFLF